MLAGLRRTPSSSRPFPTGRHRLLGDHRARSRQRRARLQRGRGEADARRVRTASPNARRRLRDQRPEGRVGVQRHHRDVGGPVHRDRRRRRRARLRRDARRPRPRPASRAASRSRSSARGPLPQGEIFFDDVRVPARNLVMPPAMYPTMLELTLCTANGYMGSTFVGVARAAFEHAVEYAKDARPGRRADHSRTRR